LAGVARKGEEMRNRRRNWFLRRLVLGFAIALVAVPVAQARPEGALPPLAHAGANTQETFVHGVPGSGYVAPELNGESERFVSGVVIVGDDKQNLPAAPSIVLAGHPDNQADRSWPGIVPSDDAYYARYALPPGAALGPQAAILAELDAKTSEYVAGAAAVVQEPVQVVSNPSDGFDWGDAGIGAGTVFGVMLLGASALLATRHVGHPAQA
jgi:hypothetical protein